MSCVKRGMICVPKGDSKRYIASVSDCDGDEVDVASASDIEFIVTEGESVNGTMWPGGALIFAKYIGDGITKSGSEDKFVIQFNPEDTSNLIEQKYYYEVRITIGGSPVTIGAGNFIAQNTQIKDITR